MNKSLVKQRFYPMMLIAVCFFAGLLAGTAWVNLMTKEIQEQLGAFGQAWLLEGAGAVSPQPGRIIPVLMKREMAAGFLWLIGMTAFAFPGLLLTAVYGGFSMAAIISLMTLQSGLLGLPVYLASVFPQFLFYAPVIGALFFWALEPLKKTHAAGFLVLLLTVAVGAVAESCLNPYFMSLLNAYGR